jgi:hypothetical protein
MILNSRQNILWTLALFGLIGWLNISQAFADPRPEAPPTGSPTPAGERTGGGTRPELTQSCPETARPPTAITPETANGATTLAYPVIWFYIPFAADAVDSVEFSLLNRGETQVLYRTSIQLDNTPGIVSVAVPSDQASPLVENITYRWYLTLNCQPKEPLETNDFTVTGAIWHTTSNPEFRWDGVWFDTLNEVATAYRANPEDEVLRTRWIELLESVGLEHLIAAPLLE